MLGDYDNQYLINKGLEGISKVEAISNMIIPHNGKIILTQKPHIITKKKGMYYTNCQIHIHGIPYVATFSVLQNSVVDFNYSMLLRKPWLKDAKVTHDWGKM